MPNSPLLLLAACAWLGADWKARAELRTQIDHNPNEQSTSAFRLKTIPAPAPDNVSAKATFLLVDGERDPNSGPLEVLHDGKLPDGEDEPGKNFFFKAGTGGGRLLVELAETTEIWQVDTYSWHANARGPQRYKLYASDGSASGFNAQPKKEIDPASCGWKLLAQVDTRALPDELGGQYGVAVSDTEGSLGRYRYFLFDISRTENDDPFGNTFYSEIAVLAHKPAAPDAGGTVAVPEGIYKTRSSDGACEIVINTAAAPELKSWAEEKLAPVLAEWYPKLAAMLASEGFNPPGKFSVTIKPGNGVAATGGTRITANSKWLRNEKGELNREAIGALLHEEIHVLQQYGQARRRNPEATRSPGWLVEGIPDYIRWFKFEPESHGADLVWLAGRRSLESIRYDAGYRVSANFLNWVTEKYDRDLVRKLNAALREGKYRVEFWQEQTGHTAQQLGEEWKAEVAEKVRALKLEKNR